MKFRIFDKEANERRRSYIPAEITYEAYHKDNTSCTTEITNDVLSDALIRYRHTSDGELWISPDEFDELSDYVYNAWLEDDESESDMRHYYNAERFEERMLHSADSRTYTIEYSIVGGDSWKETCEGYHNAWRFCREFCEKQTEKNRKFNYDTIGYAHIFRLNEIEAIASFSTLDIIAE